MTPISEYKIDKDALDEARKYLGIKLPVEIRITRLTNALGRYVHDHGGVHHISLSAYLKGTDAEWTVWHELTHARQVEEVGSYSMFDMLWTRQMAAIGITFNSTGRTQLTWKQFEQYQTTRFEAEANREADERPDHIRVTRYR